MANLIDTSYFINEIAVAQIDYPPVAQVVTDLISKYEPFYLTVILGPQLHREFMLGLGDAVVEDRWLHLRDGFDYVDSAGIPRRWVGFVNDLKLSPIAYYVYYYFLRKEVMATTGVGTAHLEAENATRTSPVIKEVNVWNQLVDMNYSLIKFLLSDSMAYGGVKCTYLKDNLLTKINELNL